MSSLLKALCVHNDDDDGRPAYMYIDAAIRVASVGGKRFIFPLALPPSP